MSNISIKLSGKTFLKTLIKFENEFVVYKDVFSKLKKQITLGEMSKKPKYEHLKDVVNDLNRDTPFGQYLYDLKKRGDKSYLESLNSYGDKSFCRFKIQDESIFNKKGLYMYRRKNEIEYIGRCLDSFKDRFGANGYGRIAPYNCLKDGQSTNCHLNHLITKYYKDIELYVHPMKSSNDIKSLEKELIAKEKPKWNRQIYK
tara:strand:+ start:1402 stop:2004 length:603 start_codon:yes stop_codon:yes gene_type:complete